MIGYITKIAIAASSGGLISNFLRKKNILISIVEELLPAIEQYSSNSKSSPILITMPNHSGSIDYRLVIIYLKTPYLGLGEYIQYLFFYA